MRNITDIVVSVIMPIFNAEKYLCDSIDSVIKQTYPFWELIIIDDFSTDSSVDIVASYMKNEPRIRLICLKENAGVANARNQGIKKSCGRYIAFLDGDDIWLPEKLEHQVRFMKERNIGFSFTDYRIFKKDVNIAEKLVVAKEKVDYSYLLKGNVIGCLTVMLDRQKIKNLYMPLERHEDYITWLKILKRYKYAYGLNEDLARYRKNLNSLTSNKFKSLQWTWNVYRKSENLSLMKSSYYFCHYILKGLNKHF